ncbi:MAG TPA: ABC transporter ATP-binding protein, partial [Bacteroidales bacterium]|nr:ABC transporter ATP-binding protein [Bacteroidales bacterium]
ERSRLALVRLLLEPSNLLVLDEPTNHLDMRSKDILKKALIKFDGTLIVVSHDRDFLDGIVNKVYEFRNNTIKEHLGGIYDFLRARKIENLKEIEKKEKTVTVSEKADSVSSNKQKYLEKKEYEKNLRKFRRRLEECEKKIEQLELEIKAIDKSFMEPGNSSDIHEQNYQKYQDLREELNTEMNNWTLYNEEIDEFLKNN